MLRSSTPPPVMRVPAANPGRRTRYRSSIRDRAPDSAVCLHTEDGTSGKPITRGATSVKRTLVGARAFQTVHTRALRSVTIRP
jgi:hypothetical protein